MAELTKVSLDSIIEANRRRKTNEALAQLARKQFERMFFDIYMGPGDFGDVKYRIGDVVATIGVGVYDEASTANFAPYYTDNYVYAENLPYRAGGFMGVNNRLTHLQNLLRAITGQIRTKLTEWDVSVYLQEVAGTDEFRGILYGLSQQASRTGGSINAGLLTQYGILNAAVSPYRNHRWDPSLDTDLAEWVPPSSRIWSDDDLKWFSAEGKQAFETEDHWDDYWLARDLQWPSWYPPFWQIFHLTEDMDGLGDLDSGLSNTNYSGSSGGGNEGKWLSALRGKGKATSQGKSVAASVGASDGVGGLKGTNNIGVSGYSPFLYGRPYGRYQAKNSLVVSNMLPAEPSLAPTSSPLHLYNKYYNPRNPVSLLNLLKTGWHDGAQTSGFYPETKYRWYWYRGHSRILYNGWWRFGHKTFWRKKSENTWDGPTSYPSAVGYIRVMSSHETSNTAWSTFNSRSKAASPTVDRLGLPDQGSIPLALEPWNAETRHYLNSMVGDPYEPNQHVWQRNNYLYRWFGYYVNDKIGAPPGIHRPILFVSSDRNTAFISNVSRGQRTYVVTYTTSSWRWFFKRRYHTHYVAHKTDTYWVSSHAHLFATGLNGASPTSYTNVSTSNFGTYMQHVGHMNFTGMYLSVDNVLNILGGNKQLPVTSANHWIAKYGSMGPTIANAFCTSLYHNKTSSPKAATLQKLFGDIYYKFQPSVQALTEIADIFSSLSSAGINALINQLPDAVKESSEVLDAKTKLSKLEEFLQKVNELRAEILKLLDMLKPTVHEWFWYRRAETTKVSYDVITKGYTYYCNISAIMDSGIIQDTIEAYIHLLYEWRAVYVAARMNKSDGTLLSAGRMERALELVADQAESKPNPYEEVSEGDLDVVYATTTHTFQVLAAAKRDGLVLAPARTLIVYVKVEYDPDTGDIIYPESGMYQLNSAERIKFVKDQGSTSAETETVFSIIFSEAVHPEIVYNVMNAGIDINTYTAVASDPNLTDLEKICASRIVEDWWKIPIDVPESELPLAALYQTEIQLIRPSSQEVAESVSAALGGAYLSPILETQAQSVVSVDPFLDADMQTTLNQ